MPIGRLRSLSGHQMDLEHVKLSEQQARKLHEDLPQFGRYVEDVSYAEVDSEGNPTSFVLTEEMRTLYPDHVILGREQR